MNQRTAFLGAKAVLSLALIAASSAIVNAWTDVRSEVMPTQAGQSGSDARLLGPWATDPPVFADPWTARPVSVGTTPALWPQRGAADCPIGIPWPRVVPASGARVFDAGDRQAIGEAASLPHVGNRFSPVSGDWYSARLRAYSGSCAFPSVAWSSHYAPYVTPYLVPRVYPTLPSTPYPTAPSVISR
jgi:hypothetical protein